MNNTGDVYKRTVQNGKVQVPEKHAAQSVCAINAAQNIVLGYYQVQADGTIEMPAADMDERDVEIVVPSDEQMERHG